MTDATLPPVGASFLVTPVGDQAFFTPERMTEEQRRLHEAARAFMEQQVLPRLHETETMQPGALRARLRQAGQAGLLMAGIPQRYGGTGVGVLDSTIVASGLAGDGSFSTAWGVHTAVGTLPVVFYGTEEQRRRYLPGLVTGDLIAASALTEPASGSDAMSIQTRALSMPEGDAYLVCGQKQWITNAGVADLFIIFAKTEDDRFTALLIDRDTPGLSLGPEEDKLGLTGSSTRSVYLDNVRVPAANVLGEIGQGHKIAFNALNVGRLKIAAAAAASAGYVLALAAPYVQQRTTFGRPIGSYGLIKEKLAGMVAETYAMESVVYRTAALLDQALGTTDTTSEHTDSDHPPDPRGLEEYAVECAVAKVLGSEASSRVIDEGLQIFGGHGYMQAHPIAKAYRDVRVTRIFEGTNEINRLLIARMLFRRAAAGRLPPMTGVPPADPALATAEVSHAHQPAGELEAAVATLERLKQAAYYGVFKVAALFASDLEEHQEFLGRVADLLIGIYALDSALGRALQAPHDAPAEAGLHALVARYLVWRTMPGLRRALEEALAAALTGAELAAELARVRAHIGDHVADNPFALGRALADAVIMKAGYPFNR